MLNRDDLTQEVMNLLVGTESDPHYKYVDLESEGPEVELDQSVSVVNLDADDKPMNKEQE